MNVNSGKEYAFSKSIFEHPWNPIVCKHRYNAADKTIKTNANILLTSFIALCRNHKILSNDKTLYFKGVILTGNENNSLFLSNYLCLEKKETAS